MRDSRVEGHGLISSENAKITTRCKTTIDWRMLLLLLSCFIRIRIFATPWSAAYQVPLPMGFSRQENVGSHQKRMPHTQGQRRSPSKTISSVQFSSVQSLNVSDSSGPYELQHARLPYPSPSPEVHSDSRPLSQ